MRSTDMTVTVEKERLLETLRENRDKHVEDYVTAKKKYREEVIAKMEVNLVKAREGGKIETYIELPEPRSYLSSYDEAISMVEWQVGDTVELTHSQFRQWVLGEWDWKQAFVASTQSYLG